MPSGYDNTTLPRDILLDQGVLYVNAVLIGATKDALRFDPHREIRNVEFAGKRSPIAGLDRVTAYAPVISGTLMEFGTQEITLMEPGVASAVVGAVTTFTPIDAGVLITTAQLLSNVAAWWPRGQGGFAGVVFAKGLVLTWGLEAGDNDEAGFPVEIAARLDMSVGGADTNDAPYVIKHTNVIP